MGVFYLFVWLLEVFNALSSTLLLSFLLALVATPFLGKDLLFLLTVHAAAVALNLVGFGLAAFASLGPSLTAMMGGDFSSDHIPLVLGALFQLGVYGFAIAKRTAKGV
jgi:hypothetical protein